MVIREGVIRKKSSILGSVIVSQVLVRPFLDATECADWDRFMDRQPFAGHRRALRTRCTGDLRLIAERALPNRPKADP